MSEDNKEKLKFLLEYLFELRNIESSLETENRIYRVCNEIDSILTL